MTSGGNMRRASPYYDKILCFVRHGGPRRLDGGLLDNGGPSLGLPFHYTTLMEISAGTATMRPLVARDGSFWEREEHAFDPDPAQFS